MKTVKINWGTGIALFYLGFVAMIAVLVIMSVREKVDLATDTYYAEELVFQEKIDKMKNAKALPIPLSWQVDQEGIVIEFPSDMNADKITGKVKLYCPADNAKDRQFEIKHAGNKMFIPAKMLAGGRYNLQIDWEYMQKKYWNDGVIVL